MESNERIRITFIGAGSIEFTRTLCADLLSSPGLADRVELVFTDINPTNLEMARAVCAKDIAFNGCLSTVTATADRREALRGADYVFCVVRVGGLEAFESDIEIPLTYGVDQCVGDTLCAGGLMYAQRGIAAMLDFCRDIRELAKPGCVLFNYANPMAMMTWAANTFGGVNCVGLCHGVQHGANLIERALGLQPGDLDYACAGINHQSWYYRLFARGREVQAQELLAALEAHPEYSLTEKCRIDVLRRFGFFSTESNGHLSEYLPWYRKRPDEISRWCDLSYWIHGETGGYLRICRETRNWFEEMFSNGLEGIEPKVFAPENRSDEFGGYIIEALETGKPFRAHVNMPNSGCIQNLPADCVVEAPAYIDRHGIHFVPVGRLPEGAAAVCNQSVSVQRLGVLAAVHGDDALLRQAMLLDPLVGAVLNPPEVWQMVDELLVAQARWLPQYRGAIEEAKRRLQQSSPHPRRDVKAFRHKPEELERRDKSVRIKDMLTR